MIQTCVLWSGSKDWLVPPRKRTLKVPLAATGAIPGSARLRSR